MGPTPAGSDPPKYTEEQRLLARLAGFASGADTGGSAVPTEVQRQVSRLERSLKMVSGAGVWRCNGASEHAHLLKPSTPASCTRHSHSSAPCAAGSLQAAIEPPLPGLCSQPGSDVEALQDINRQMQLLRGAVYALEMACAKGRLADLAITPGLGVACSEMQDVLLRALALASAACAGSSEALAHMPVWGPCSGECPDAGECSCCNAQRICWAVRLMLP